MGAARGPRAGRTGTALGIDAYGQVRDFIIDPDSGGFIGYREVLLRRGARRAGRHGPRVVAMTTSVVDEPAR